MKFRPMKFRVESPEHSRQIQQALFELGYKWSGETEQKVKLTDARYLFADDGNVIRWLYASHPEHYLRRDNRETTLEELHMMTRIMSVPTQENIDLIKRIETLEKQMSMIHAYNVPKQKPKFATGRIVEGLEHPIEHEKHVEFTHRICGTNGYELADEQPKDFVNVAHLGECVIDGDMFSAYSEGCIEIYKGHLNSGTY